MEKIDMTSAEIVLEFLRGRPQVLAELKEKVCDPFRAPEIRAVLARELVLEALNDVSNDERTKLDRMRGNGPVDWQAVVDGLDTPHTLPEFHALEWARIRNRGFVAIVECDKERDREHTGLPGIDVLIDGELFHCTGVERHVPAFPIQPGERIGLLVREK